MADLEGSLLGVDGYDLGGILLEGLGVFGDVDNNSLGFTFLGSNTDNLAFLGYDLLGHVPVLGFVLDNRSLEDTAGDHHGDEASSMAGQVGGLLLQA